MSTIIFIPGEPKPQPRPRARVLQRGHPPRPCAAMYNPPLPWRKTVRDALELAGLPKFEVEPVSVTLDFLLPRPASHYGTGRNSEKVKPSAPIWPLAKRGGDSDNLAKAVLDSMSEVCFHDDSQVVLLTVTKRYTSDSPGVRITYATVLAEQPA